MIGMKTTHEFVAAAAIATIDNAAEKCCSLAEGGGGLVTIYAR